MHTRIGVNSRILLTHYWSAQIKPDYVDSMHDTLDVIILGGYYGSLSIIIQVTSGVIYQYINFVRQITRVV